MSRKVKLSVEELEQRMLLAVWQPFGPQPETGLLDEVNQASGRVSALAYSSNIGNNTPALFLGSASGGVWETTTPTAQAPVWQQVTDGLMDRNGNLVTPEQAVGTNDIGALAVDPNNPKVIYAGTGEANYDGSNTHTGGGILRSDGGGAKGTWTLWSTMTAGMSISKIIVDPADKTGDTLFVAVVPNAKKIDATTDPKGLSGLWRVTKNGTV